MIGAKEGQDILVSTLIQEPEYFLDIGCAEPIENNNTYALEKKGWRGILIDKNPEVIGQCREIRNSDIVQANVEEVTWLGWLEILRSSSSPSVISYISLDVDDANIPVIQNLPFDKYEFKIMTFETEKFNTTARQDACNAVLGKYPQYQLLLEDAQLEDGRPWEDWWINTKYFDKSVLSLKSKGMYWKDFLNNL